MVSGVASPGIKKLEAGRREQGVLSTSVTDPTPASTMFLATCLRDERALGSGWRRELGGRRRLRQTCTAAANPALTRFCPAHPTAHLSRQAGAPRNEYPRLAQPACREEVQGSYCNRR